MKNLISRIIASPAVRKALIGLVLAVAAAAGYSMTDAPGAPAEASEAR